MHPIFASQHLVVITNPIFTKAILSALGVSTINKQPIPEAVFQVNHLTIIFLDSLHHVNFKSNIFKSYNLMWDGKKRLSSSPVLGLVCPSVSDSPRYISSCILWYYCTYTFFNLRRLLLPRELSHIRMYILQLVCREMSISCECATCVINFYFNVLQIPICTVALLIMNKFFHYVSYHQDHYGN